MFEGIEKFLLMFEERLGRSLGRPLSTAVMLVVAFAIVVTATSLIYSKGALPLWRHVFKPMFAQRDAASVNNVLIEKGAKTRAAASPAKAQSANDIAKTIDNRSYRARPTTVEKSSKNNSNVKYPATVQDGIRIPIIVPRYTYAPAQPAVPTDIHISDSHFECGGGKDSIGADLQQVNGFEMTNTTMTNCGRSVVTGGKDAEQPH